MAYATQSDTRRPAQGRLTRLVDQLAALQARRSVYRRTRNELNALSDRDLADLGIHRTEIRRLAYEAAYTK